MKIILLGSSPVMMLQALILSQKYKDIEIHEAKNEIGGSWKPSSFNNLKKLKLERIYLHLEKIIKFIMNLLIF